jgi:hypothetical protein
MIMKKQMMKVNTNKLMKKQMMKKLILVVTVKKEIAKEIQKQ